jgi:hypothetical protein
MTDTPASNHIKCHAGLDPASSSFYSTVHTKGNPMSGLGKTLIIFGLVMAAIGIFLVIAPKVPWLGKLPGDIMIKRDSFRFYFPITTCVIVSILLTLLFYLFRK